MEAQYIYNAKVVRVVDGDTVVLDIDMGFRMTTQQITRLLGLNAPEVVGATKVAGLASKAYLQTVLPVGCEAIVRTFKPQFDKYGRYLAIIHIAALPVSVNEHLIDTGYAVKMDY